jgi:rubrerythrin
VKAYVAESMAVTRYTYYAKQADKENFYPIGHAFRKIAENELHHGKVFFKLLDGGVINISLEVDAGIIGNTESNLITAMHEEEIEGVQTYLSNAQIALEEGFPDIAMRFRAIAMVEQHHRDKFKRYLKQVIDGTVWHRDHPIKWRCLVCGNIYDGLEPPAICPACNHPREHYIALDFD